MSRTIVLCVLLLGTPALLRAQLPIFDDFEDGSATDGDPAMWNPSVGGTRHVSDDGDYIVSDSDLARSRISGTGGVRDVSVRTRLRLLEGGAAAGVYARGPPATGPIGAPSIKNGEIGLGGLPQPRTVHGYRHSCRRCLDSVRRFRR